MHDRPPVRRVSVRKRIARAVLYFFAFTLVSAALASSTFAVMGQSLGQEAFSIMAAPEDPTVVPGPTALAPAASSSPVSGTLQDRSAKSSASGGSAASQTLSVRVPVYNSFDFLRDYLTNGTGSILLDAKPWDNSSFNFQQYQEPGGGTSYWDYWPDSEAWDSPSHQWRDADGNWHTFTTDTIKDANGNDTVAYVLVDRAGPGVMDKLWFTHNAVHAVFGILHIGEPPELSDWGDLSRLGNLRIQVDDQIVYDGPIINWFSGDAQHLTPALKEVLVWRYRQFGSSGNILPIPYQSHIKVSVYGGPDKPKWFMVTGLTLPQDALVKPYATRELPITEMDKLASSALHPESYVNSLPNQRALDWMLDADHPLMLAFQGTGTLEALEFKLPIKSDLTRFSFQITYGKQVGINLPVLAFFSEPGHVSLHHSTPIGLIESGDSYVLYSNLPMPYQNGMTLQVSSDSGTATALNIRLATSDQTANTQLRTLYDPGQRLLVYGPNYNLHIDGTGKLVGLVLQTGDEDLTIVPRIRSNDKDEDPDKRVWPMGYLEGNLTLSDGVGHQRFYSGQEDWAEGGFYFNLGYTSESGGGNRPFAGILRYRQADDGYATLFRYFNDLSAFPFNNGLDLSFGHGTWNNNFAVTYAATAFYYEQVQGVGAGQLPASNYLIIQKQLREQGQP
jgi:hypothetical protein